MQEMIANPVLEEQDFRNWYVLQIRPNREEFMYSFIKRTFPGRFNVMLFLRELIHVRQGNPEKIFSVMFPGYLFIHKEVYLLSSLLKEYLYTEYAHPVALSGRKPSMVSECEMKVLIENANNKGVFEISTGDIVNENKIRILDGPLKRIDDKIVFINKKKHKAKVKFSLFNKEVTFSLGIKILSNNLDNFFKGKELVSAVN